MNPRIQRLHTTGQNKVERQISNRRGKALLTIEKFEKLFASQEAWNKKKRATKKDDLA